MTNNFLDIKIYAFAELGQYIWFVPWEYNALCRYNKEKKNIDYMTLIPGEWQTPTLYSKIVVYGKNLILIPYAASEVAIFDTEMQQFEKLKLPVPDNCYKYRENAKFLSAIRFGNQIYLLPGEFPQIVCLNMENRIIQTVKVWYPLYGRELHDEKRVTGAYKGIDGYFCFNKKELYITFYAGTKGKIGVFSFETHEMDIFTIAHANSYFSCMEIYGDDLYLVTRSGQIFCWNTQSREVAGSYSYVPKSDRIKRDDIVYETFRKSILYDDKIYLFWADKPQYTVFDLKSHKTKTYLFQYINSAIRDIYFSKEHIYIFTNENNLFYQMAGGKIEKILFKINGELLKNYLFEGYLQKNISLQESVFLDLRKMLPVLTDIRNKENQACANVGRQIYDLPGYMF